MAIGLSPRHVLMRRSLVGAGSFGQSYNPTDLVNIAMGLPPGVQNLNWANLPPGLGFPNGLNFQNGPMVGQPRVYPISLASSGNVTAGATVSLEAKPQATFKPERLSVPSSIAPFFLIRSIKIGARLQTVDGSDTGIPAEVFSEVSQNNLMNFDTCQPGVTISMQVTNTDSKDHPFIATFIGPANVP